MGDYKILGASKGACPMCGDKEKKVFTVVFPGYVGDLCGDHMHTLCQQIKQPKPEATLFGAQ